MSMRIGTERAQVTLWERLYHASEDEMPMDHFLKNHVQIITHTPGKDVELMTLLWAAMTLFHRPSDLVAVLNGKISQNLLRNL